MDKKVTKRLSRDTTYTKTKKSYQSNLSPSEIKKKLEEYIQIDNIRKVPLNSHVRYFTFNPSGDKFIKLKEECNFA